MKPEMLAQVEEQLYMQGGFYTWEDILDAIEKDEMTMLAIGGSFAVVRVFEFPQKKVIDVVILAGDAVDMPALEDAVETFKAGVGASGILGTGRVGWMKRMHGNWRMISVNYLKE